MKQLIQNLKTGETILEEVPTPAVGRGKVLIRTAASLVSLGTEKMLVSFGQANLLQKARSQPEKVRQVLDKVSTDGLQPTIEAVLRKLDTPLPLGYSQAGIVVQVGSDVTEFKPGDRVASNGHHAEYVVVPKNLVVSIPDEVLFEEASFGVVGSIALQGIRLANPTLGEKVVVIGLGLIGLITAQLLKANGCQVLGIDLDPLKVDLLQSLGIEAIHGNTNDPVQSILEKTNGIGADAVIITASTSSNAVIKQAAQMSRKRGRIILVGVIGLQIDRSDFYEKELTFQVSCSYGPGRYDEAYEQQGIDYPIGFVRWTEKRNIETIINSIKDGQLNVRDLITERVKLQQFGEIYNNIAGSDSIASILQYPDVSSEKAISVTSQTLRISVSPEPAGSGQIAIVGAGNFTQATVLPALKQLHVPVKYIVSAGGLSSTILAKKFGIPISSTNIDEVYADSEVSGLIIATRHHLHAPMVLKGLDAGKHVFIEKPLCLNKEQLDQISKEAGNSAYSLTVGFNRRFSPHSLYMKKLLGANPGPMNITATINAGFIPATSWVHNLDVGGGRIIGEACHFIDLMTFLSGSKVVQVSMQALGTNPDLETDNVSIHLKYENGTLGVINYFANGHKAYAKERVEVFYQQKILVLDNFRKLSGYGWKKGFSSTLLKTKLDKGHKAQFQRLCAYWKKGGIPLIPLNEIINTTAASFGALEALKSQSIVTL